MKKIIYALTVALAALSSCSDFTELQPKGKNMLSTVDDLELLLNQDKEINTRDLITVGGDAFYAGNNSVISILSVEQKNITALRIGYFDDEQSISNYVALSTSDGLYSECYSWVGTVANPILQQLSYASGSEAKKNQLKSEALALRAYAHYLILQKFAKAYNSATAANDPGIIYMTEDIDIAVPQEKKTVQECYELALQDINAAIETGGLPSSRANASRFNKAAGYAIKAHICMAMQKYEEAKTAAKNALAENSILYDYWSHKQTGINSYGGTYEYSATNGLENPENYWVTPDFFYYLWVTPSAWNDMEDGYYTKSLVNLVSNADINRPDYVTDPSRDVTTGVPGWQSIDNLGGSNYDNTSGLTVPMMYLYCAECELRSGNTDAAIDYLDQLRKARMSAETFTPLKGTVKSRSEAITWMKRVSFEENVWNGWNFMQRKRWNVEPEWETTLSRTIGGVTYTLSPKSNLWIFPFPMSVRNTNVNLTPNKNN